MSTRPASSPWLVPFKWSSGGFLAGAASVGVAWATMGGRVAEVSSEPREQVILADRAPEPRVQIDIVDSLVGGSVESAAVGATAGFELGSMPSTPTERAQATEPGVPDGSPELPDRSPSGSPVLRININAASLDELDLLPGIGPALAQRIIDERTRTGRFVSLNDLQRVRGIGPKTVEKLQGLVVFE